MAITIENLERAENRTLMPKCTSPYEKYLGKIDWAKDLETVGSVKKGRIPRIHLFGTQNPNEYSLSKRKGVETRLKKCGAACLERHPVVTCILSIPDGFFFLPIIDGHHRTRYSGNFDIYSIPAICLTPDQLAQVLNNAGVNPPVKEHALVDRLLTDLSEVLRSFNLPPNKQPRPISSGHFYDLTLVT